MVLELRQQLKLTQQLVMTPQLQQAIKLLQLSRMELNETVQAEMEQNPMLEEDTSAPESPQDGTDTSFGDSQNAEPEVPTTERTTEVNMESQSGLNEINWADYENEYETTSSFRGKDGNELPSRFDILTEKPNLQDHLQWQLKFSGLTEDEEKIGQYIIGNLTVDGFLEVDEDNIVEEMACTPEEVQRVLAVVQDMDPSGVGARNLKESLLLQLTHLNLTDSNAFIIVRDHLYELERKNYAAIVKSSGLSLREVLSAVEIITGLNPHPGRSFSDEEPHYIIPDVYVYKVDDDYVILLNDEGLPRLKISPFYKEVLKDQGGKGIAAETKGYIQEKLKSALWLIKSIQQRQRTIYKVVESIIKFQRDFFEKGPAFLRPLILRDVAEDIFMHESTISRVTTNKYVHTPQGIFELKYFFNSSIERLDGDEALASSSIKIRLKQIIQEENPEKPYSDMAIAKIFEKDNIKIARRTIAKYREAIGILPSKYRKKPKFK